jgi:hypothetical protein
MCRIDLEGHEHNGAARETTSAFRLGRREPQDNLRRIDLK